jgi:hypothetical protein
MKQIFVRPLKKLAAVGLTFVLATPATALDVDLAALLANPDALPEAALAACATGVINPDTADAALLAAGWEKTEGEGSWDYTSENTFIMMWAVPGFCMAEVSSLRTVEFSDALMALGAHTIPTTINAEGCEVFEIGAGVTATLSGPGQDSLCTSDDGATMRFELTP